MENATLFCTGSLRGVRTASVCSVDGSPFKWAIDGYDPRGEVVSNCKTNMLTACLRTCAKIANEINFKQDTHIHQICQKEQFFSKEKTKEIIELFNSNTTFLSFIEENKILNDKQKE